jgi:hypothetical protein
VGLERSPLSLMSSTEELLGRKNSDSSLENREYGHRERSSGRSVHIVHSLTQAMEFVLITFLLNYYNIF